MDHLQNVYTTLHCCSTDLTIASHVDPEPVAYTTECFRHTKNARFVYDVFSPTVQLIYPFSVEE